MPTKYLLESIDYNVANPQLYGGFQKFRLCLGDAVESTQSVAFVAKERRTYPTDMSGDGFVVVTGHGHTVMIEDCYLADEKPCSSCEVVAGPLDERGICVGCREELAKTA